MSQSNQNQFSSRVLQQTISGSLKQELAAAHLQTTTRRSNKELKFLTSQIAQYPFANLEQAQTAGVLLGQHLAAMAQQRGQPTLEGGIIQQLRFQPRLLLFLRALLILMELRKTLLMTTTEALTAEIKPLSTSNPTDTNTSPESTTATESLMFQAVGIIKGEVNFSADAPATVTLNQKQYRLFYARNPLALSGLKQEIEQTGISHQRLIVYPKVTHFPKRDQPHQISFNLVGFDRGRYPTGISHELALRVLTFFAGVSIL